MINVKLFGYFKYENDNGYIEFTLDDINDVKGLYYDIVRSFDYDCLSRDEIYELLMVDSRSVIDMIGDLYHKGLIIDYSVAYRPIDDE